MNRLLVLILITFSLIACKNDNGQLPEVEKVTGTVDNERIIKEVSCDGNTYVFQVPYFKGTPAQEQRTHQAIMDVIAPDLKAVTYDSDASFKDVFNLFIEARKKELCSGNTSGLTAINIEHITQNEKVISYELTYVKNNEQKRTLIALSKPDLEPITAASIVKKGRETDIKRIFDINMQQSVADLSLLVPTNDQMEFREFMQTAIFYFEDDDISKIPLGIKKDANGKLFIQAYKSVTLPRTFTYLNKDVKVDIDAEQMDYYVNLNLIR